MKLPSDQWSFLHWALDQLWEETKFASTAAKRVKVGCPSASSQPLSQGSLSGTSPSHRVASLFSNKEVEISSPWCTSVLLYLFSHFKFYSFIVLTVAGATVLGCENDSPRLLAPSWHGILQDCSGNLLSSTQLCPDTWDLVFCLPTVPAACTLAF